MSESVLGGSKAPKTAKKSNTGVIVAIIVAALIIAGGAVAAVLLLNNNNNGDGSKDGEETSKSEGDNKEKESRKPYASKDNYFIKIDGKKYTFENKVSDLEESGYSISPRAKDQKVPANKYLLLIGASSLSNDDNDTSIDFTAYNDTNEKLSISDAKLGKVGVSKSTLPAKQAILEEIKFYGGIHLGSTRKALIKAFGEPTDTREYKNYSGGTYEKIEYQDEVYRKFEFQVEDDVVTEISWTNYGKLAD